MKPVLARDAATTPRGQSCGDGADAAGGSWGIRGDQRLLAESARVLRSGFTEGGLHSHGHGECASFGLARLLDAVAFSLRAGDAVNPAVIAGAMDVARHVRTYQRPRVQNRPQP